MGYPACFSGLLHSSKAIKQVSLDGKASTPRKGWESCVLSWATSCASASTPSQIWSAQPLIFALALSSRSTFECLLGLLLLGMRQLPRPPPPPPPRGSLSLSAQHIYASHGAFRAIGEHACICLLSPACPISSEPASLGQTHPPPPPPPGLLSGPA